MVQRFRDSITELSRRLGELGPSARLLIGSLAIILAMGFFLVSQYAAGPSMSPIKVRIEDKATAISRVRELGYEVVGKTWAMYANRTAAADVGRCKRQGRLRDLRIGWFLVLSQIAALV